MDGFRVSYYNQLEIFWWQLNECPLLSLFDSTKKASVVIARQIQSRCYAKERNLDGKTESQNDATTCQSKSYIIAIFWENRKHVELRIYYENET